MASTGELYGNQDDSVTRLFDSPMSLVGEPSEPQSNPQNTIQETNGVSIDTEEPETREIHKPQPISRQEQLKNQDERPTIEGDPFAALAQAITPEVERRTSGTGRSQKNEYAEALCPISISSESSFERSLPRGPFNSSRHPAAFRFWL